MTPAQKIKNDIADWCRIQKFEYFGIVAATKNGKPDCIIDDLHDTWYFEVKAGKDRLSSLQKHTIKTLNVIRERAFVVSSVGEVIIILKRVSKAEIMGIVNKNQVIEGDINEF